MNNAEEVTIVLEQWKKVVEVQQHFNNLELRIRNYAIVVTGALLAPGGSMARTNTAESVLLGVPLFAFVVLAAVIPILAFWFMDRL